MSLSSLTKAANSFAKGRCSRVTSEICPPGTSTKADPAIAACIPRASARGVVITPAMKDEGRNDDLTHTGGGVVGGGRAALALPGPPGLSLAGRWEPVQHLQCQPPATEDAARRRAGTGRGQNESPHARRMVEGEAQGGSPAHGVPHDDRSLNPQHVEKAFGVVGHLLDGVGARRLVAPHRSALLTTLGSHLISEAAADALLADDFHAFVAERESCVRNAIQQCIAIK